MKEKFTGNTRGQKKQLLYDGHNKKPGTDEKAQRWRRIRRRMARWMKEAMAG